MTPQRASPAELLQKLIVTQARLAIYPGVSQVKTIGPPQCYCNDINDEVDKMISVTDMAGMNHGRVRDGRYTEHYGLKLTFRDLESKLAFRLGYAVQRYVDSIKASAVSPVVVCMYGTDHNIEHLNRTGTLTYLGEEAPKRRFVWGITYRMVMSFVETQVSEC